MKIQRIIFIIGGISLVILLCGVGFALVKWMEKPAEINSLVSAPQAEQQPQVRVYKRSAPSVQDDSTNEETIAEPVDEPLPISPDLETDDSPENDLIADYVRMHGDRLGFRVDEDQQITVSAYKEKDNPDITSVEIPSFVTGIDKDAFRGAVNLVSIVIPDSVTSIGDGAFADCAAIKTICIPNSVTSIGANVFSGCQSLVAVDVDKDSSIRNQLLDDLGDKVSSDSTEPLVQKVEPEPEPAEDIPAPNAEVLIADYTAKNGDMFTFKVNTNQKVELSKYNEKDKASVTSVEIPDFVSHIGESAFFEAKYLEHITIPDSVESIGLQAFYKCSALRSLKIPAKVKGLTHMMCNGCTSLKSITLPDTLTSIAKSVFLDCKALESITIPASVTSIKSSAFVRCQSLTPQSFIIQGDRFKLEDGLFMDVKNGVLLSALDHLVKPKVVIPEVITQISSFAFMYCENVEIIVIPESVTTISEYAFGQCKSVKELTISASVTSIGKLPFEGCQSLKTITTLGNRYKFAKGLLVDFEANCLVSAVSHLIDSQVVLPKTLIAINESAFDSCAKLKKVRLPNSLKTIGIGAFSNCSSLKSVTIPNSVTKLDSFAFYNCQALEYVTVPDSVTELGNHICLQCAALKNISVGSRSPIKEQLIKAYRDKVKVK